MMLRWQQGDLSMTTFDRVDGITLLGVWGLDDPNPGYVDEVGETPHIVHGHNRFTTGDPASRSAEAVAWLIVRRLDRVPELWSVTCSGMWLMDDHGDTIDTIVAGRPL